MGSPVLGIFTAVADAVTTIATAVVTLPVEVLQGGRQLLMPSVDAYWRVKRQAQGMNLSDVAVERLANRAYYDRLAQRYSLRGTSNYEARKFVEEHMAWALQKKVAARYDTRMEDEMVIEETVVRRKKTSPRRAPKPGMSNKNALEVLERKRRAANG